LDLGLKATTPPVTGKSVSSSTPSVSVHPAPPVAFVVIATQSNFGGGDSKGKITPFTYDSLCFVLAGYGEAILN
jgi:hypothetical protein